MKRMRKRAAALSMQTALALAFTLFVLLSAGIAGYLSQRSGRESVEEIAARLRGDMATHIGEHVRHFLHIPHIINRLNADALGGGMLDVLDERSLEFHFRKQIDVFPSVSSIYFGNTSGGLVNSGREAPFDSRYVIGTIGSKAGVFRKYSIDKDGNRTGLLAEVPDFDARTRGWYSRAQKSGGEGVWSDVYVLFTGQDMAITASRPVYDAHGGFLGVAAVDLSLSQLTAFLQALPLGEGTAFIMERSGLMLASSRGEPPFVFYEGGEARRLHAADSVHAEISGAALFMASELEKNGLLTDGEIAFESGGERCYLRTESLHGPGDLDWIIAVTAPEREFMDRIDKNNRTTTLVILFAVLLSFGAALLLARRMAQPVLRLNAAARAITRGENPPELPVDCEILEVGELSASFNRMAEALRETIRGLNEEIGVRKETESRVRAAMERAEDLRKEAENANRAKSEFLANMSHEIRTPLNGVVGFLDMLRGPGLDQEQLSYVDNAKVSAYALLEIISNILDISKIEAGKLELETVRTDIPKLLEESLVIAGHGSVSRGVRVFSSVHPPFPRSAYVDPLRLRQVLVNLLGNAVKFTEEGEVELSASFQPSAGAEHMGLFTFSVRDTGIGIRKEDREKLFRPFSQADASNTRKYGGTGLGLVISNGILKKMGSALELESEPGNGSRFSFTVSARYEEDVSLPDTPRESKGEVRQEQAFSELSSRAFSLLIVEDLRMNRTLLRLLASRLLPSAAVFEAENGERAVEIFRTHAPDIVFMDMHMPVMNGFEATAAIRELEKARGTHTPIVALTADVLSETRERCFQAGMDDFLPKPIEAESLRAVLERYLSLSF